MADQDNQDAGQTNGQDTGREVGLGLDQGQGQDPGISHSPGSPEGTQGLDGSTAGGEQPEGDLGTGTGTGIGTGTQAAPASAVPTSGRKRAAFLVTGLLLLALAATLAWLAWQKHAAEQLVKAGYDQEQADLKLRNDEYEAYLNRLRALLKLDPCDIAPALANIRPPAGRNLPALPGVRPESEAPATSPTTPSAKAPSAGSGVAPAQPSGNSGTSDNPDNADRNAGGKTADESLNEKSDGTPERKLEAREPANIAELLEQNTVLILASQERGVSMGTGFFLSPDTIMTNAHVVGNATEAVYINTFVGSVRAARVLLRTRDNGLDFAVLRTNEPVPVKPLQLQKSTVQRMEKVSAWGFPAAVTRDDPNFMGLLRGNAKAAPQVVYTEGSVSVVLDKKPPVIVHTATVSQGNSGGPLVNEQGEVVGINTMIKLDDKSYRQSSLAIPSSVMAKFLEANKVPFTMAPVAAKDDAGANARGGGIQ